MGIGGVFNSENDFIINFFEKISPILKKATIITIAKEEACFNFFKKSDEFKLKKALDILLKRLESVM